MDEAQDAVKVAQQITEDQLHELLRPNTFEIIKHLYTKSWIRRVELMHHSQVRGGAFQSSINRLIKIGFVVSRKEGEKDCRYNLTTYGKRRYPLILRAWDILVQVYPTSHESSEGLEIEGSSNRRRRKKV